MMTEDLSGDCLNIPAWWRFLHRPLFHSLQVPHTLQCIYSPNRGGCYLNMWSLGVSVGRKTGLAERGPLAHPSPPNPSIVPPDMVPVVLLPELSTNGSFGAILCPHQTLSAPPALAGSCASSYTDRKAWSSRDVDTDPSASEIANIDQPRCKGALLIYPKPVLHPGK